MMYPLSLADITLRGTDGVYVVWLRHAPTGGARHPFHQPIDVGQSRDIGYIRFRGGHPREPQWQARQRLYLLQPEILVQAIETPPSAADRELWRRNTEAWLRASFEAQGYILSGDR